MMIIKIKRSDQVQWSGVEVNHRWGEEDKPTNEPINPPRLPPPVAKETLVKKRLSGFD